MRRQAIFPFLLVACALTPFPSLAQPPDPPGQLSPQFDVLRPEPVAGATAPDTLQSTLDEAALPHSPSPADRLSVGVELILWWLREGRVPPLLTTSSAASAGILGRPDTQVLYGDQRLETRHGDRFNGTRIDLGYWFDDDRSLGVEISAFFLERDSTHFKAESDGSQVLARPFLDAVSGNPASEVIAGPSRFGLLRGGFVGYSRVELFGEEANVVTPLLAWDAGRLEGLAGLRFLQMRDRVDLTATGHPIEMPSTLLGLTDHFRVGDAFYGGQVGLRGELVRGPWRLSLTGEVAPGAGVATVRIFGDRTFQTPEEKVVTPYGLAVQLSNAGRFTHADFAVVSQAALNVEYRLSPHVRVFTGYTFLWWANALRAGDQIDLVVNRSPNGPSRPALPYHTDDFWAQGFNAGLELTW
jgi:hypothetical protein